MKKLLKKADENNCALGAFSVGNMEMVIGAIRAAEHKNTPIIIQIAEARLKYSPLECMGPMMVEYAKKSHVDICVHLDHGASLDVIQQALEYGFTSVMFDGSKFPLEKNISLTHQVIELADSFGASVEAELGIVGGSEGTNISETVKYTDVNEAISFCQSCNIDALAIAIGNVHGHYKGIPNLNFSVLENIHKKINKYLVLHGGSGISSEDFRKSIQFGIRKINIATSSFDSMLKYASSYLENSTNPNYFDMNVEMIRGVEKNVEKHIDIFNC